MKHRKSLVSHPLGAHDKNLSLSLAFIAQPGSGRRHKATVDSKEGSSLAMS
jgi:hypothetical protein